MDLLIPAIVVLALLAALVGFGYLLSRYRNGVREKLFELYELKFKIQAPSSYRDQAGRKRAIKKAVKLKWKNFKLVSVRIKGEPGALRISDGFELAEQFSKRGSNGEFIPELELISSGVFEATFYPENSDGALLWQDEKSVFNALRSRYVGLDSEREWPTLTLNDWNSAKQPHFTSVFIQRLPSKLIDKYDEETLTKSFGTMFARHNRVWKMKQLDSHSLEFTSYDRNSDEVKAGDATFTLENMLKSVLGANRSEFSLSYSKELVRSVHATNGAVDALALHMNDGYSGRINEPAIYQRFVQLFIAELKKEWPGDWKSQNNLLKDGRILFKKF